MIYKDDDGVTIVMPALNEENNIIPSIKLVQNVFDEFNIPYELILINDGSIDNTGKICDNFSNENENITVIHHNYPKGMGSCYKEALILSKMPYFMLIVSKNECEKESIKSIIKNRKAADMVIPYTVNQNQRDFFRRYVSQLFTYTLNILTGIKLNYFNGTVLHNTHLLKKISFDANYHTFQSEALIKLIKLKYSYIEVPTIVNWNKKHKTNAFKIKNISSVFIFLLKILLKRI